jgi:hypothetical protein
MTASRRHLGLGACLLAAAQALAFGAVAHAETAASGTPAAGTPAAGTPAQPQQAPAAGTQTPPAAPVAATVTLSNDKTSATWAHAVAEANIYSRPILGSRVIARTHLLTADGFPEVYLLLSSFTDARGRTWVHMRIPGRPNGRIGWVPREVLGEYNLTHWLIDVSLSRRTLKAYYNGHLRFTAPVGVGKPSTPTPPGHFWIRERFRLADRSNPYWPWALGTSDYSTLSEWPGGGVVGIHGDFGDPAAIPGDPSHGCIRMRDNDIAWLAPRIQVGTPVDVNR